MPGKKTYSTVEMAAGETLFVGRTLTITFTAATTMQIDHAAEDLVVRERDLRVADDENRFCQLEYYLQHLALGQNGDLRTLRQIKSAKRRLPDLIHTLQDAIWSDDVEDLKVDRRSAENALKRVREFVDKGDYAGALKKLQSNRLLGLWLINDRPTRGLANQPEQNLA